MLIIIIILLLTIIIIFHRLYIYFHKFTHIKFDKLNLSKLYDQLQDGDLLLTTSYISIFNSLWDQSFFTHVAMIYKNKKNNLWYVTDTNYGDGQRNIPLLVFIENYHVGSIYYCKLKKKLDKDQSDQLYAITKQFINYPTVIELFFFKSNLRALHCFQYLKYIYYKLNIDTDKDFKTIFTTKTKILELQYHNEPIKIIDNI